MKKYKITLNNKVYEVEIEEVTEATDEEDATTTKIGSFDKDGNIQQYFGSNEIV